MVSSFFCVFFNRIMAFVGNIRHRNCDKIALVSGKITIEKIFIEY